MADKAGYKYSCFGKAWYFETVGDYGNASGTNNGYIETTTPFDHLLMQNKNVYPVASDDMHSIKDAFMGFAMVKSPSLKYDDVFNALKRGNFYSSEGPIIKSLVLDGTNLNIECSECRNVILTTTIRKNVNIKGKDITNCVFDLSYYFNIYEEMLKVSGHELSFRLMLVDGEGKRAYTRAYFIKDLKI